MKVWDQAGIELATPRSAVRHVSAARHVTDCAMQPRTTFQAICHSKNFMNQISNSTVETSRCNTFKPLIILELHLFLIAQTLYLGQRMGFCSLWNLKLPPFITNGNIYSGTGGLSFKYFGEVP